MPSNKVLVMAGSAPVNDCGANISQTIGRARGKSATMPIVITSDTPFPMPRSVICSPIHINNMVPHVSAIMVCKWYQTPP